MSQIPMIPRAVVLKQKQQQAKQIQKSIQAPGMAAPKKYRTANVKPLSKIEELRKQYVGTTASKLSIEKRKEAKAKYFQETTNVSNEISNQLLDEERQKITMFLNVVDAIKSSDHAFFNIVSVSEAEKEEETIEKLKQLYPFIETHYSYIPTDDELRTIFLMGSNLDAYNSAAKYEENAEAIPEQIGEIPFLMRLTDFLGRVTATPNDVAKPVFCLTSPDQLDGSLTNMFKYEHNPYSGQIVNVDVNGNLTDTYISRDEFGNPITDENGNIETLTIEEPDGRIVAFNMLNDPDEITGHFRLRDCYGSIESFISTVGRFGERAQIPIINRTLEDGHIKTGHIATTINPEIVAGVDAIEAVFDRLGTAEQLPFPDDINDIPIYICISNVPESYAHNVSVKELFSRQQEDIAGFHSGFLILYKRTVYSAGFGAVGGQVEELMTIAKSASSQFSKGVIMSRDYLFDLMANAENKLHVSDVGILRKMHLVRMTEYINEIGYVNIGGMLPPGKDNILEYIIGNFRSGVSAAELAAVPEVREYFSTALLSNYGFQYVLPKTAYTLASTETEFLSKPAGLLGNLKEEQINLYKHTGTNCARFIQSIFNDRITCAITSSVLSTVSAPAQCRRLPHLNHLTDELFVNTLQAFLDNNVAAFIDFTQALATMPSTIMTTIGRRLIDITNGIINFISIPPAFVEAVHPDLSGGKKHKIAKHKKTTHARANHKKTVNKKIYRKGMNRTLKKPIKRTRKHRSH